ncbi:hypothetical protein YC2023_018536 [Brassica napus]
MIDIYTDNTFDERKFLWNTFLEVKAKLLLHNSPWIIGRDFNEIIHCAEHFSLDFKGITPQMIEFKYCIDDLEAKDLRFHGAPFLWTNKQQAVPISKKLDHHTPSLANIEVALRVAGTWPFKFYNFLIAHPDFLTTIQEGWKVLQPETWSLSALSKKQKIFEKYLKKLHKNNYSEIQKKSRRMKSKRQTCITLDEWKMSIFIRNQEFSG